MRAASPTKRNSVLLVVLLSVQLLLMSGSVRGTDGSTLLETVVLRVTAPVVWVARGVGNAARGLGEGVREVWVARSENRHLREENLELRAELDGARERVAENERLRTLLDLRRDLAPGAIAARVVGRGESGHSRVFVLDRGTDDGVRVDAPVIAWGGVVGRVLYADPRYSKVLLFTDRNSGIAAVVQRSRASGILFGGGDDAPGLDYVSGYEDVVIGDRVVTSGMDGVFPRGLSLGRVIYVNDGGLVSLTIRVQPAVDLDTVEEVLVLAGEGPSRYLDPPVRETDR